MPKSAPIRLVTLLLAVMPFAAWSDDWPALSPDDFEELSDGGDVVVEEPEWNGQADVGYLASSGNTDTSNLNAKLILEYLTGRWKHIGNISAVGATDSGATTAERYQAGYKAEYSFSESDYLFALVSYDKDRFSGLDQRTTEAAGYGRRLIHTDTHLLDIEAGLGATQIEREDGTEEDDIIARLAGSYAWKISETASFSQTLAVESGESNTYAEAASTLKASLNDHLALSLGYTVKRNSEVPVGRENTDTYTSVSLSYSF